VPHRGFICNRTLLLFNNIFGGKDDRRDQEKNVEMIMYSSTIVSIRTGTGKAMLSLADGKASRII